MPKIMVTGAFGNVGANVIRELQMTDAEILAIDLETKQNLKTYRDLRKLGDFVIKWLDNFAYKTNMSYIVVRAG